MVDSLVQIFYVRTDFLCLVPLIPGIGVVKSPIISIDFYASPLRFVRFCLMYFYMLYLVSDKCRIMFSYYVSISMKCLSLFQKVFLVLKSPLFSYSYFSFLKISVSVVFIFYLFTFHLSVFFYSGEFLFSALLRYNGQTKL